VGRIAVKDVAVFYARAYEGVLHSRCYAAWDRVAAETPRATIIPVRNPDERSHYDMLELMWEMGVRRPERYLLLTEADFLPDLTVDWLQTAIDLMGPDALLGPRHVEWTGDSWEPRQEDPSIGASFMLFDTHRLREGYTPEFRNEKEDPGTTLHEQFTTTRVLGTPDHFSMKYPFGCHLFWSRIYNDEAYTATMEDDHIRLEMHHHGRYPLYCLQRAVCALLFRWELLGRV
jgi:hypothetical protein